MKFVGLDGLSHFWSKAKTWIINRITAEVTAKIAEIVANAPEDLDTLKEIADWISTHEDSASAMNTAISTNTSDIAALQTSVAGKSDTGHTHTKSEITDFPTSLPANGGTATKASLLDEYVGAGGTRLTSGNIIPKDATEYGGMRKDVVTTSMTDSGRPGMDGHLLTMFWDNSGRFDSQFFIKNGATPELKVRGKDNQTDYSSWTDVITSNNIGSQTVAKATNATNDSNGNNIANTYMPKSGGTFSGNVTFKNAIRCKNITSTEDSTSLIINTYNPGNLLKVTNGMCDITFTPDDVQIDAGTDIILDTPSGTVCVNNGLTIDTEEIYIQSKYGFKRLNSYIKNVVADTKVSK